MLTQIFEYKSKSKTFVIFKNDNREKWNRDGSRRKSEPRAHPPTTRTRGVKKRGRKTCRRKAQKENN